jgi:outer membrane protein assembly factor BamB
MQKTEKKGFSIIQLLPIALIFLGVVSMMYLYSSPRAIQDYSLRLPVDANKADSSKEEYIKPSELAQFIELNGVPADIDGSWPRFRGANLDAISIDKSIALAQSWPEEGPEVLWSLDLGEGYAGAAVLDGRVYIIDYDMERLGDLIRCVSLEDGRDIWQYFYPVKTKRYHGMSRTVPAVTEKYMVTIGPKCHVTCLDSKTGRFFWMLDLIHDYGATLPTWYTGQCPLVIDDMAIIGVGGDCLIMAVDCETGEIIWQTPNPENWKMSYSSVLPVEFEGTKMYVYCATGGVVGVDAQDGSILWQYPDWKVSLANVPTPVYAGNGRMLLSGGYNAGAMMLKLSKQGEAFIAQEQYRLDFSVFGAEQQTPIFYEDYFYAVRQDEQLVCMDTAGRIQWTSTSVNKFGLGPYVIANGLIYIMDDDGVLSLVKATSEGYIQLDQTKVLQGPDAWGPMAVVNGRLLLRDLNRMICIDITVGQLAMNQ